MAAIFGLSYRYCIIGLIIIICYCLYIDIDNDWDDVPDDVVSKTVKKIAKKKNLPTRHKIGVGFRDGILKGVLMSTLTGGSVLVGGLSYGVINACSKGLNID